MYTNLSFTSIYCSVVVSWIIRAHCQSRFCVSNWLIHNCTLKNRNLSFKIKLIILIIYQLLWVTTGQKFIPTTRQLLRIVASVFLSYRINLEITIGLIFCQMWANLLLGCIFRINTPTRVWTKIYFEWNQGNRNLFWLNWAHIRSSTLYASMMRRSILNFN